MLNELIDYLITYLFTIRFQELAVSNRAVEQ